MTLLAHDAICNWSLSSSLTPVGLERGLEEAGRQQWSRERQLRGGGSGDTGGGGDDGETEAAVM